MNSESTKVDDGEEETPTKSNNIWKKYRFEIENDDNEIILNKIACIRNDSIIKIDTSNHFSNLTTTTINNNCNEDEIIRINISGIIYETYLSTIERYPMTLLGNKSKRISYWNNEKKEYFFDRHRTCFESILYYYQSNGRLRRPDYIPLDTFIEEITFFQLGSQALEQTNKLENLCIIKPLRLPKYIWRQYIWYYFEYPQNSKCARIFHLMSLLLTVISCLSLSIETLPEYNEKYDNICKEMFNISLSSSYIPRCSALFSSPFFIIETICVIYFTIEFLLRIISVPSYRRLILSVVIWTDLSAIIPYYVFLSVELTDKNIDLNTSTFVILRLLRFFRFLRVFKIYLIFRQLKSLRVLAATLKESYIDFLIMLITLTLVAFLFGAATYFTEKDINPSFDSIFIATYWAILTITSVGYGDMYPISPIGRILSCLCSLFGAATMGILISVLVDRYQRVYNRKKYFPQIDSSSCLENERSD